MNVYCVVGILVTAMFCNSVFSEQNETGERIETAWARICEEESTSATRMARISGFIRGAFQVDVPKWWRSEGYGPYSSSTGKGSSRFGSHPSETITTNNDSFSVRSINETESVRVQRVSDNHKVVWSHDFGSLYPGVQVMGYSSIDCGIALGNDKLYIFGRNGSTRFILALKAADGSKIWNFAFLDGNPKNLAEPVQYNSR